MFPQAPVGRILAAAAAAAGLAGLVIAAGSPATTGRLLTVLALAALAGAAGAWWLDRRYGRPIRRLRRRLDELSGTAAAASGSVPSVTAIEAAVDRVAAEMRRQTARARDERSHLREIVESMADGVLVTARDQRVELLNPSFRALFAVREPGRERPLLEISRSPALVGFVERLAAEEGARSERIESEAGRTLELRGRRLEGGRTVVVARDLTEQLRLDATRRDLVANVSHELRTPLTAIRGYAENLRDGAAHPATAARFLDRILAQCGRLEALLEDLLALSRLEGDRPVPLADRVDLVALAGRSLETVRGLAAERRVTLRYEPPAALPMVASEEALERLLLNLLENAIKYNREGGMVTVGLVQRGGEIVLEVADTGIGVPRRDLDRIFERFYRVDRGRSRGEGGTGLGLAIVKHAAHLHGGRVEVESELGRGSVFRVRLPAAGGSG